MLPTGSTADKTTSARIHSYYCTHAKQLQSKDIPAIVLGDNGESIEALLMYNNQPLIAYLTPEYLFGPSSARRLHTLKQLADTRQLALIAIDEAHLLFEWEHFR